MPRTILVAGGAMSGPTAAARARETDEEARIILLERAKDVSYAVCGLAYHLSGEVASLEALNREKAALFEDVYGIEVRTGVTIEELDAKERCLLLSGGEEIRFDTLVYALGAASVIPTVFEDGASNLRRFRNLEDLRVIRKHLEDGDRRVTIIGGGPMGIEAADGLGRHGCKVTLLEKKGRLLPRFSSPFAEMAAAGLEALGCRIMTKTDIAEVERGGDAISGLVLRDGTRIETDLVIAAPGLRPRTELLAEAGVELAPDGTVPIDARASTSAEGIYACGVCASVEQTLTGERVWLAQAAEADKTAQVAGSQAAGGDQELGPMLGTAIVRSGKTIVGRVGLTREEVKDHLGGDPDCVDVHAPSREVYFPGSEPVALRCLADPMTGALLGAEVGGKDGVAKRLDVLATAIAGGLTVEELADLDLAHAPPFSRVRDPINVLGTVASAIRSGLSHAVHPSVVIAENPMLVDVREEEAVAEGTIPGAHPLPLVALRERISELPDDRPVVFVSETGRRAYLASRIARERGYSEAAFLSGGLRTWRQEGCDVTTG